MRTQILSGRHRSSVAFADGARPARRITMRGRPPRRILV
jgi:hypothetical protein